MDFKHIIQKQEKPNGGNFSYLDKLIQDGSDEIVLESDIILSNREASKYLKGIPVRDTEIVINGNGHIIDAKSKAKIFNLYRSRITLKNITFRNGYCEGHGAAIESLSSKLNISGCSFESNKSQSDGGGAIYSESDEAIIEKSRFCANAADIGGAICIWESKMSISECTFHENSARNGGTIYQSNGDLAISSTAFDENNSKNGGANDDRCKLNIYKCRFSKNDAKDGGAIANHAKLEINESMFKNNTADNNGGAISNNGALFILESDFNANSAYNGGAIRNDRKITVLKSRFEKNTAKNNGGAILDYECAFITECCFIKNSAQLGSGLYTTNYGDFTNEMCLIYECEFKDNSPPHEAYMENVTHKFILRDPQRDGRIR